MKAFRGRHYDDQDSDTARIREIRNCLKRAAAGVFQRNHEAEVAWASRMGLRAEFEVMLLSREAQSNQLVPSPTVGQSQHEARHPHSPLITLSACSWVFLSPRPASEASTTVLVREASQPMMRPQVLAGTQEASVSSILTTVSSFVCVDTGNLALSSLASIPVQLSESRQGATTGELMPPCDATHAGHSSIVRVPAGFEIADESQLPSRRHAPALYQMTGIM